MINKKQHNPFKKESKFKNFFKSFKIYIRSLSKIVFILLTYLAILLIGTIFLATPLTWSNPNSKVSIIDALFTSSSAFSDTGLVVFDTYKQWNIFGQILIATLILLGGIGIFAFKVWIFHFIFRKKKLSLNDIQLISIERAPQQNDTARKTIIDSVTTLMVVLISFSLILSFYFYWIEPNNPGLINNVDYISPHKNWSLAFRYGFFHTISALNNAGFDIIGQNSLSAYQYNYSLHVLFLILLLIGGLGFPVIHDFINFLRFRIINGRHIHYQWRLITKISTLTYLIITVIGFFLILLTELSSTDSEHFINAKIDGYEISKSHKIWQLFFTSISTRSAGFALIDNNIFTPSGKIILLILMFIGAGPASTGGGIRTTTFAILMISLFSRLSGRESTRAFRRTISEETVKMSFYVFFSALILVLTTALICSSSLNHYPRSPLATTEINNEFTMTDVFFEVTSAFGTCGLGTGLSAQLNVTSKIFLILTMFIGQFGVSSTILLWGRKTNYSYKYDYITEDISIG
ncbi:TrkH family potassium uptake protein [Mycoplasmopsis opalescens]|uniref:TrkH family potassium uptake protein n=1 Tax=Mycoplasmopsis opalescens TaxID=114886 RepID=UPI0004A6CCFB|nr:potassium transporter TrkG [Mycoplasmopsis opalescens]